MKRGYPLVSLLLIICLVEPMAGGPPEGHFKKGETINPASIDHFLEAFAACLEAQRSIGNPLIDTQTGKFDERFVEDYFVDLTVVPQHRHYYIFIRSWEVYFKYGGSSCRIRSDDHMVLQAAYYEGDVLSDKNLEEIFVEHVLDDHLTDEELADLLDKQETTIFSLEQLLRSLRTEIHDCTS